MIRLTVTKPDAPPEVFVYDTPSEVVVGRSSKSGIVLDRDPMVSRSHAVFLFAPPASAKVKDLHSTNGIRINGQFFGTDTRVNAYDPITLKSGDEVAVGSALFKIETSGSASASARASSSASSRLSAAAPRSPDITGKFGAMDTVQNLDVPLPRIPGYRLARYLGTGSAGKIYLGVSNGDERKVAVKILHPPSGLTPDALRFFFKEFDDARHIVHPHLARLLGAGELPKGGGVFVAAEYADGHDLSGFMRRAADGRLDVPTALSVSAQISGAMCRLHMRGMTHLDLKPSSVILREENGQVSAKVTDAGFTAFLEMTGLRSGALLARKADRLGFLAPEQLRQGAEPGKAADVFALSALLFSMLTGKSPVAEQGGILSPDGLSGVIPARIAAILKKGLAANPEDRYPDACRLVEAFTE